MADQKLSVDSKKVQAISVTEMTILDKEEEAENKWQKWTVEGSWMVIQTHPMITNF